MHARVQIVRTLPPHFTTAEASGRLIDALQGHPGFRSVHLMLQIGTRQGLSMSLWDSCQDADAAAERTQAVLGRRPFPFAVDEVYDVLATMHGSAAPEEATVCQVNWFDGPRSAAQNEALRPADEDRVGPAIQDVPGFAAAYVLCHPGDSSVVVLSLATSTDTLERMADAVYSTSLLPGENPALLDSPDRVEVYRLENRSPAGVPVA